MKDYYRIIGTSRDAIYNRCLFNEKFTDEEMDNFIREKYEYAIRTIEYKRKIASSQKVVEELNKEAEQITFAYEQIKSPILREEYNRSLNNKNKKQIKSNSEIQRKVTAYDILNISKETMKLKTEEENDEVLKRKKNRLLDRYTEMLENCKTFSERTKIELEIQKINQAYELVRNAKKRNEYHEKLEKEHEEQMEKVRRLKIKKQYSHREEFDPSLIQSRRNTENKMVVREDIQSEERLYIDKENRHLRLLQTGRIIFKNSLQSILEVSEYQVKRKIKGQEKSDTIYTTYLNIVQLSKNAKTGKPYNPKYYDCIINRLLSEETIEGSKYNAGYIGEVEKDKEGNYSITIGREKLKPREKEYLTAVMIIKNREKEVGKEEFK